MARAAEMPGQWKLRRVAGSLQPGHRVDMHGSTGPELCLPGGGVQRITSSMGRHKLLFKLVGCERGHQHYRLCTPKTVTEASDLWCPFHAYNQECWQQAGKRVLPDCELWFMALLVYLQIDTQFCLQTMAPFWHQPLDFFNVQLGYFVQIDGRCHWVGMMQLSRDQVLDRDMKQNRAVLEAAAAMARIHERDLACADTVYAALAAAALDYSIVLSPSYAAELYNLDGNLVSYVYAVQQLVPNCCCDMDQYGNYRFWLM